ncbi:MAG: transcriptional regulator, TetR family [Myxococcales bacterium]|nr:transcriptional regulator, TetR family [Myxococcales bacterium]
MRFTFCGNSATCDSVLLQREFKQRRSAATYESLLLAAARVFARLGFDAAQTPEIASEAGVSTGAFYRYFPDKRAIFVEVVAHHLRESHAEVMARLTPEHFVGRADGDRRKAIDLVIEVLFDRIKRDADLERVYLAMSYSDPEVRTLRAEYEALGCHALAKLIEVIVPRTVIPDAVAAARVIGITAVEIAADRAGLRPRTGNTGSDRAVQTALREMLYRYLFPDAPDVSEPPARPARRKR